MKSLCYVSSFGLLAAILAMTANPTEAAPKKVLNSGNSKSFLPKNGNPGTFPTFPAKTTKAGGGGGATAKAGDVTAKGGNGGNASGKGAKGGNGGDAIAVSGNNNTVVNGDNNTVIGKVVNNNISLNIGGGGGFGGGGGGFGGGGGGFSGGFVSPAPVANSGFVGDSPAPSTPVVAPTPAPSETVAEDGEREQVFTRRFLKVKNDSTESIKVFVQYRGMEEKKWVWIPADPTESQDALVYDLKPGQEMYIIHKGRKVEASRVRVWGVGEKANWFDYRDQDLWVVPEIDQRGEHRYQATQMGTFSFVFPQKTEMK